MTKITRRYLLASLILFLGVGSIMTACGGSSGGSTAEIDGIDVKPDSIAVGDRSEITVGFSPPVEEDIDSIVSISDDEDPDYHTDGFDLVIRLPSSVKFVEGSSSIVDSFFGDVVFGDGDPRGPNRFELCSDGSTALLFEFSTDELDADNPVQQTISFQVEGRTPGSTGSITASAAFSIPLPCLEPPDSSASITVR